MSDRDPKKERVFGCGPKDPKARLQGREIVRQGNQQGLSPMDVLQFRATRIPSTDNLKNN